MSLKAPVRSAAGENILLNFSSTPDKSKDFLLRRLEESIALTKRDLQYDQILLTLILRDALERESSIGLESSPINSKKYQ
jgi:hypothetical protein